MTAWADGPTPRNLPDEPPPGQLLATLDRREICRISGRIRNGYPFPPGDILSKSAPYAPEANPLAWPVRPLKGLMLESPLAREDHGHLGVRLVAGLDGLIIPFGTTRVSNGGNAFLDANVHAVPEREEGI